MRKHLSTIILVLVFLVGLSVLLYPTVSDWWNSRVQTRAIADYESTLADLDEEDYTEILARADAYNEALAALTSPLLQCEELTDQYTAALNVNGTSIMGYLTIPEIDVELPIYHTTSDSVLAIAVGHLEGSSLPVGGEGTHCVLSGHRGLPSAKLFTDLDQLKEGDTFTITVLNTVLTYQVDQIRIVEPDETEELAIVPGKDYCTLLTCTPYGVNTERLLMRGVRIETVETNEVVVTNEAQELDSTILAPVIAAPILFVLLIVLLVRTRKPRKK